MYVKGKYFDFWVRKILRYSSASCGEGSNAQGIADVGGWQEVSPESVVASVSRVGIWEVVVGDAIH
jgi:hypothetical protein